MLNTAPVPFAVAGLVVAIGALVLGGPIRRWTARSRRPEVERRHAVPGRLSSRLAVVVAAVASAVVLLVPRFDSVGAGFFVLWLVLFVLIAPRGYRQFQARTGDVGVRDGDDGARL